MSSSTPPPASQVANAATVLPPVAEKREKRLSLHGDERIDEYYWLRDDDREDADVLAYLHAENAYLEASLKPVEALRQRLFEEMTARIREEDSEVPAQLGDYWYSERYVPGKEYALQVRHHQRPDGPEEVLLDENQRAAGHDFYRLGGLEVSDDHRLLAFAEDTVSRRLYTVRVRDLETGEYLPVEIPDTSGAMAWSADGRFLFYVLKDEQTLLPYRVMRHELGTSPAKDVVVREEEDETFYTSLWRGKSGDYIYIHHGSTVADEVRLIPASRPQSEPLLFLPRERHHEYSVSDRSGRFYILTNRDARNFRLVETDLDNRLDVDSWREVVAHRKDVFLDGVELFENFIAVNERSDGLLRIRIFPDAEGSPPYLLESDEPAYSMELDTNLEMQTDVLRYAYTSLTTPDTIYDISLTDGTRTLLKREPVEGPFDPGNYRSERIDVEARDGARVPVSIVYRKPFVDDGTRPLLIYGYGAYGSSREPAFSAARLSLLDRGFVYAIAHIRGGQEMGRDWYDQGRMFHKKNTFNDFVDVTRGLIERGYGDPQRVFAYGGSAGGLLMGAVINQAPELYNGVVAAVPFVDVVTTMLDTSIPLTTGEFDEWGNPQIPDQYDYMLSYSPYDQVTAQAYPNLLVTTGLYDSQVQYFEPAKWVARLRDRKTDDNLLLLYTDMESGHGGASGRYQQYADTALRYAFLLWLADAPAVLSETTKESP